MILNLQSKRPEISELDNSEEINIRDLETIEKKITEHLGDLNKHDLWEQMRSYSILWHRLFTQHNRGKRQDGRISDPITLLGNYCKLYHDKKLSLQDRLYVPLEFSNLFIGNSWRLPITELPWYYSTCNKVFTDILTEIEQGENLNREEIFSRIKKEVYVYQ